MAKGPSGKLAVLRRAGIVSSTALVQPNETFAHRRIQNALRRLSEIFVSRGGTPHEIRGDILVVAFSQASDAGRFHRDTLGAISVS